MQHDLTRQYLSTHTVSVAAAGIPNRVGSYEDVAKDPAVEICYVGMLHPFHYDNAVAALQNGKHVLMEKPSTPAANVTLKRLYDWCVHVKTKY